MTGEGCPTLSTKGTPLCSGGPEPAAVCVIQTPELCIFQMKHPKHSKRTYATKPEIRV